MLRWRVGKSLGQAMLCYRGLNPCKYISTKPLYSFNGFSSLNSSKFINSYLQLSQRNPFSFRGKRSYSCIHDAEDDGDVLKPSLINLLGSPQRDYVITNKGEKVPIHTLEEKVVALYFYEGGFSFDVSTEKILNAYEEVAKTKENFEVVLIYVDHDWSTCNEESYWEVFKTMPWLALPFKDPNIQKLKRNFEFCLDHFVEDDDHGDKEPALVIFGPHGEFIEPLGGQILNRYPVYPFTREKAAMLEAEKVLKLKMEMLWDPNTVFTRTDGSHVRFSQLAGKRVILFFEAEYGSEHQFLNMLKESYLELQGTNDEFEVIHILEEEENSMLPKQDLPWLVSLASHLLPGGHVFYDDNYYGNHYLYSTLVAFDEDGNVVRRTIYPVHEDTHFPFYSGSVEEETLSQLVNKFWWDYWNYYPNKGQIYTFHKKTETT